MPVVAKYYLKNIANQELWRFLEQLRADAIATYRSYGSIKLHLDPDFLYGYNLYAVADSQIDPDPLIIDAIRRSENISKALKVLTEDIESTPIMVDPVDFDDWKKWVVAQLKSITEGGA